MVMGNMSRYSMLAVEDTKKKEEQLSIELRSLLVAGTALSVARKRVEVKAIWSIMYQTVVGRKRVGMFMNYKL